MRRAYRRVALQLRGRAVAVDVHCERPLRVLIVLYDKKQPEHLRGVTIGRDVVQQLIQRGPTATSVTLRLFRQRDPYRSNSIFEFDVPAWALPTIVQRLKEIHARVAPPPLHA